MDMDIWVGHWDPFPYSAVSGTSGTSDCGNCPVVWSVWSGRVPKSGESLSQGTIQPEAPPRRLISWCTVFFFPGPGPSAPIQHWTASDPRLQTLLGFMDTSATARHPPRTSARAPPWARCPQLSLSLHPYSLAFSNQSLPLFPKEHEHHVVLHKYTTKNNKPYN